MSTCCIMIILNNSSSPKMIKSNIVNVEYHFCYASLTTMFLNQMVENRAIVVQVDCDILDHLVDLALWSIELSIFEIYFLLLFFCLLPHFTYLMPLAMDKSDQFIVLSEVRHCRWPFRHSCLHWILVSEMRENEFYLNEKFSENRTHLFVVNMHESV